MDALARRLTTLRAALAFLQLPPHAPELRLLHQWLDSWRGVGEIVGGMLRLGYETEVGPASGLSGRP